MRRFEVALTLVALVMAAALGLAGPATVLAESQSTYTKSVEVGKVVAVLLPWQIRQVEL